jgi:diguanylate cyclase (GGDEF)-like protein
MPSGATSRDLELARSAELNVLASSLNARVLDLMRESGLDTALEAADRVEAMARSLGERQVEAEAVHTKARCHFQCGNLLPALELLQTTAALFQQCGDQAGLTAAFAGIGVCQHKLGAHTDAISSLTRALDSARNIGHHTLEIEARNALGSSLIALGRFEDADHHLAAGVHAARTSGQARALPQLLLSRSMLSRKRADTRAITEREAKTADLNECLQYAGEAMRVAIEIRDPVAEAQCAGQIGSVHRMLGQVQESREALMRALTLARTIGDGPLEMLALAETGHLLIACGAHADAATCLLQAYELCQKVGERELHAQVAEALSRVYEDLGDAATALRFLRKYHELREAELTTSRRQLAHVAELSLNFREISEQASKYREQVADLSAERAALLEEATQLVEASQRDPLTKLLNRRGLQARIVPLMHMVTERKLALAVAIIDVDRFKHINDGYSHSAGDHVLQRVATLIRAHCRQHDLPIRYGGDEFMVVLAGVDLKQAVTIMQRLKRATDELSFDDEAPGLKVTLSIGVAEHRHGDAFSASVAVADAAMYNAKKGGRDRIVSAPPA